MGRVFPGASWRGCWRGCKIKTSRETCAYTLTLYRSVTGTWGSQYSILRLRVGQIAELGVTPGKQSNLPGCIPVGWRGEWELLHPLGWSPGEVPCPSAMHAHTCHGQRKTKTKPELEGDLFRWSPWFSGNVLTRHVGSLRCGLHPLPLGTVACSSSKKLISVLLKFLLPCFVWPECAHEILQSVFCVTFDQQKASCFGGLVFAVSSRLVWCSTNSLELFSAQLVEVFTWAGGIQMVCSAISWAEVQHVLNAVMKSCLGAQFRTEKAHVIFDVA